MIIQRTTLWVLAICFSCGLRAGSDPLIELDGVPLQMEWADIDGDGTQDLVALMLQTKTEGSMETWYEDGGLRGVYADQTTREKYLVTCLHDGGVWKKAQVVALGRTPVLGFALSHSGSGQFLMLWQNEKLIRHHWQNREWVAERELVTPGLLAQEAASLSDFPFWYEDDENTFWVVPDFSGIRVLDVRRDQAMLLGYPQSAFERSKLSDGGHRLSVPLPKLQNLDRDPRPELTFRDGKALLGYQLGQSRASFDKEFDGMLADFDGDGLLDLIVSEEQDVDRMKDLPKIKTHVRTYLASEPMVFSKTPTADQMVSGMLNEDGDSGLQLAPPFLDINGDGRADLAGVAFKFSIFQAAKVVVTGQMTFKFLLHLSVQKQDGSFRELAGGPFPMVWKINLRRLRLPSFAQLAADFDGDGWIDIMMDKGDSIQVTPVTGAGISPAHWKVSLPKALRDPDQIYGRDLTGKGRASFVVVKLSKEKTRIGLLERHK